MPLNIWKFSSGVIQDSQYLLYRLPLDRRTLKVDDRPASKLKYIISKLCLKMSDTGTDESLVIAPPQGVKGMTQLVKAAFSKRIKLPGLKVPKKELGLTQKSWKRVVLKLPRLNPVAELSDQDPLRDSHSLLLLDPLKLSLKGLESEHLEKLKRLGLDVDTPQRFETELGYDNWSVSDILRAVLPSEVDNVTSYTQVGHIAHLNLKPETLPFKNLIGQVIVDKVPSVKTVVNKLNSIDNTYRNFSMELLAGEDNFVTQTKEHNCVFELDFSKVYWNSRLSTEHQRIVELVPKGSTVYDVFAGIGPFAIPLAKKKQCTVYANDLNPASYESLTKNIPLNNIKQGRVIASNLDGKEFILTVVKPSLEERVNQLVSMSVTDSLRVDDTSSPPCETVVLPDGSGQVKSESVQSSDDPGEKECERQRDSVNGAETLSPSFIVMNLPATAVEFLPAFRGLLRDSTLWSRLAKEDPESLRCVLPRVFCYAFSPRADMDSELRVRVEACLGCPVPQDFTVRLVRNVAPNKEMVCLSFTLWPQLLVGPGGDMASTGPCADMTSTGPHTDMTSTGPHADMASTGPCTDMASTGPCADMASSGPAHSASCHGDRKRDSDEDNEIKMKRQKMAAD